MGSRPLPPADVPDLVVRPAVGRTERVVNRAALERMDQVIAFGIIAVLAVAPAAIGTVHPITRGVVFAGCGAVLAGVLVERWFAGKRLVMTAPHVLLGLMVALTALQLVPLPRAVVATLSPNAHELLESALGRYRFHALSLDPVATAGELTKLAAYLALYTAAAAYARHHDRRSQIVSAVAIVATAIAVLGFAQAVVGSEAIMFVYQPHARWGAIARGSFVNPAHFGALLTLAAPCALVAALGKARFRPVPVAAVVVINLAAALTLSRSSIASVFLSQILTLVMIRLRKSRGPVWGEWRRALVPALVVATVVGSGAVAAYYVRGVWSRSVVQDLTDPAWKFQAWRQALQLVHDYPLIGVGRGAFEYAFTRVSLVAGLSRYAFLENGYMQALVDFGAPAAVVLAGLAGWVVVASVRRLKHDIILVAPFAALAALAAHEAVDFAVELPGVALPALALLAVLHGRRDRASEGDPAQNRWNLKIRAAFFFFPGALIVAAVVTAVVPTGDASGLLLAKRCGDPTIPTSDVLTMGERLRRRHPADHYVPLVVAARLAQEGRRDAMHWINAAVALSPRDPAAHQLAAGLLARYGHKGQALLEYRTTVSFARDPRNIWPHIAAHYRDLGDLLAATPAEPRYLELLAEWLASVKRVQDATAVYTHLLELYPENVTALHALIDADLAQRNTSRALDRVRVLKTVSPGPQTQRLEARVFIVAGDLGSAARILDGGIDLSVETFDLEMLLADAVSDAGRSADALLRMERVERLWTMDNALRARFHDARATILLRAGNIHQAQWELERRRELVGQ
jgi:hypothetical protein